MSGTINPSRSTVSRPLRENSGGKERVAIQDDARRYTEHCICGHLHRTQMTRFEAQRGNSAVRSHGKRGLFHHTITIVNKPNARMYTRTEDIIVSTSHQNQPSLPEERNNVLDIRWKKLTRKSEQKKEGKKGFKGRGHTPMRDY